MHLAPFGKLAYRRIVSFAEKYDLLRNLFCNECGWFSLHLAPFGKLAYRRIVSFAEKYDLLRKLFCNECGWFSLHLVTKNS